MIAKTQIGFFGHLGSNHPGVTKEELIETLLKMETETNKNPRYRIHIFYDVCYESPTKSGIMKETNESKLSQKKQKRRKQ